MANKTIVSDTRVEFKKLWVLEQYVIDKDRSYDWGEWDRFGVYPMKKYATEEKMKHAKAGEFWRIVTVTNGVDEDQCDLEYDYPADKCGSYYIEDNRIYKY